MVYYTLRENFEHNASNVLHLYCLLLCSTFSARSAGGALACLQGALQPAQQGVPQPARQGAPQPVQLGRRLRAYKPASMRPIARWLRAPLARQQGPLCLLPEEALSPQARAPSRGWSRGCFLAAWWLPPCHCGFCVSSP